ncbi:MAG: DNA recombination/repair protein RecA [Loktanella sp.]|nr:DNA recombination/repair protein RecA [Loktanella sp.]
MATKKKPPGASSSIADCLMAFQKEYGDSVGSFGGDLVNTDRVPTGLFPLDLALAGGLPRGKVTIIYGPESSSKTNLALLAIAEHQRLWPDMTCTFFDIENSFDPQWAATLGVDTDKLVVLRPGFAEHMVDMVEAVLFASDCGLVVVDSLAAVMTTQEFENQIRFKIGILFGNPETQPGGNAPRFQASLILRVYGKNISDPKISAMMPIMKETKFVFGKWKMPIYASSGEVSMVTLAHKGLRPGMADDFNMVSEYLKDLGLFNKAEKGKGWVILGESYGTIQEFKDLFYKDTGFGNSIRQALIARIVDGVALEEEGGSVNG